MEQAVESTGQSIQLGGWPFIRFLKPQAIPFDSSELTLKKER
jgi:hypothetical protein